MIETAMILAAGKGERMRPLTDSCPKPLLKVKGKSLIEHQLIALQHAGIKNVVINLGYLGEQISDYLGNGQKYEVNIHYSDEGQNILETAGGIIKALPLLGEKAFLVTNGDIFTDFNYQNLLHLSVSSAHLVLVDNPPHNPQGDFSLNRNQVLNDGEHKLTYSGIGIFHPNIFKNKLPERQALAPILRRLADDGCLYGQHFRGFWSDVGTPDRLKSLN